MESSLVSGYWSLPIQTTFPVSSIRFTMEIYVDGLSLWRDFRAVALICVFSINLSFFPFWIGFIGKPFTDLSFARELIISIVVTTYIVLYVLAVWVLSKRAENVSDARNTLKRLQLMYLEVILVFASFYYLFALFSGDNQAFQGPTVTDDLDLQSTVGLLAEYLKYLYFSVVTGTTLGFGEITPASGMTRFLVVSQVLLQLYIVVIGVGLFFSSPNEACKVLPKWDKAKETRNRLQNSPGIPASEKHGKRDSKDDRSIRRYRRRIRSMRR